MNAILDVFLAKVDNHCEFQIKQSQTASPVIKSHADLYLFPFDPLTL